jgi:hypothetical protein
LKARESLPWLIASLPMDSRESSDQRKEDLIRKDITTNREPINNAAPQL